MKTGNIFTLALVPRIWTGMIGLPEILWFGQAGAARDGGTAPAADGRRYFTGNRRV